MITRIQKSTALVLLAGLTLVACKKHDDSTDASMSDTTSVSADTTNTVISDTTAMPDTTHTANGTTMNTPTGNNESAGSVGRRASRAKTSGKNNKGYSAPNGSDAENHDGDQYTKNDNRPMPSGSTSMK